MKEKWMAASVTTEEALQRCIDQKTRVFCIEKPLYDRIKEYPIQLQDYPDYEIMEYPEKSFFMVKLVRGHCKFDEERYEIYYFPLKTQNEKR